MTDFSTSAHGKWILAGEHAVLRGCPAIVFPIKSTALILHYEKTNSPIEIEFTGEHRENPETVFRSVLQYALKLLRLPEIKLTGKFRVHNTIRVSAGMGASAALSVVVARWFAWQQWIQEDKIFEFARQLEDLFHGESSGADIAVILNNEGILYSKNAKPRAITLNWQPKWYLSYSDTHGITANCIEKVKLLWQQAAEEAKKIDEDMHEAVQLALEALYSDEKTGFPLLVQSVHRASQCFSKWGLITPALENHMRELSAQGAIATKPTGSGEGGFVLSIWSQDPPASLLPQLIAV